MRSSDERWKFRLHKEPMAYKYCFLHADIYILCSAASVEDTITADVITLSGSDLNLAKMIQIKKIKFSGTLCYAST